ncbi:MAG: hypothetical protein EOO08_09075 [Chitinophagaceae bacterium]|nr:MAG: hypothetical protein EOO08_09075 [Chitinophagaceae bacterium]
MRLFLLSLAYRVTRSPFAAWALLALSLALLGTALLKGICWLAIPGALRPDTLRSFFQLAPFSFIPMAVYLGLAQYRWRAIFQKKHRLFAWSNAAAFVAFALWIVLLMALFGFNLVAFPR